MAGALENDFIFYCYSKPMNACFELTLALNLIKYIVFFLPVSPCFKKGHNINQNLYFRTYNS